MNIKNVALKRIELDIESSAIVNQIFSRSKQIRDFHKLAAAKGERRRRRRNTILDGRKCIKRIKPALVLCIGFADVSPFIYSLIHLELATAATLYTTDT